MHGQRWQLLRGGQHERDGCSLSRDAVVCRWRLAARALHVPRRDVLPLQFVGHKQQRVLRRVRRRQLLRRGRCRATCVSQRHVGRHDRTLVPRLQRQLQRGVPLRPRGAAARSAAQPWGRVWHRSLLCPWCDSSFTLQLWALLCVRDMWLPHLRRRVYVRAWELLWVWEWEQRGHALPARFVLQWRRLGPAALRRGSLRLGTRAHVCELLWAVQCACGIMVPARIHLAARRALPYWCALLRRRFTEPAAVPTRRVRRESGPRVRGVLRPVRGTARQLLSFWGMGRKRRALSRRFLLRRWRSGACAVPRGLLWCGHGCDERYVLRSLRCAAGLRMRKWQHLGARGALQRGDGVRWVERARVGVRL
jgi:hypothetical protein